jgi:hypothetical protein
MRDDSVRNDTGNASPPDAALGSAQARWIEFYVPRVVGDALQPLEIAAVARAAGHVRPHYEYRTVAEGRAMIVADYDLVPFIVEAFIDMAKRSQGAAAVAAGAAAIAGLEAISPWPRDMTAG